MYYNYTEKEMYGFLNTTVLLNYKAMFVFCVVQAEAKIDEAEKRASLAEKMVITSNTVSVYL